MNIFKPGDVVDNTYTGKQRRKIKEVYSTSYGYVYTLEEEPKSRYHENHLRFSSFKFSPGDVVKLSRTYEDVRVIETLEDRKEPSYLVLDLSKNKIREVKESLLKICNGGVKREDEITLPDGCRGKVTKVYEYGYEALRMGTNSHTNVVVDSPIKPEYECQSFVGSRAETCKWITKNMNNTKIIGITGSLLSGYTVFYKGQTSDSIIKQLGKLVG